MNEDYAEVGGDQPPPTLNGHVVPCADVVDVDRDGGVCPHPVLLHQRDQIGLSEVSRGRGLSVCQLYLLHLEPRSLTQRGKVLICRDLLVTHNRREPRVCHLFARQTEDLAATIKGH